MSTYTPTTDVRENRKPPVSLPATIYLARDATTGLLGTVETAAEAEFEVVRDATTGLIGSAVYAGISHLARVGERVIPISVAEG